MSILMFEGFDLHWKDTGGLEAIGEQDDSGYPGWNHTSNTQLRYVTDATRGRIAWVISADHSHSLTEFAGGQKQRAGFWIRTTSTQNINALASRFIYFTLNGSSVTVNIQPTGGSAGVFDLGISTVSLGTANVLDTGGKLDATWRYTEFLVDTETGDVELWQEDDSDGVFKIVASATVGDIVPFTIHDFHMRSPYTSSGGNMGFYIDDLHLTDGESLMDRNETLHAVSVVRTQARGSQSGAVDPGDSASRMEGHIYIDGVKYDDGHNHGSMNALIGPTTQFGYDRTNVFHGYFMQNPATNADWGNVTVEDVIENWGLCRTAGTGRVYVQNAALAVLAPDADGYPDVTQRAPGILVSLTGDWLRSDATTSWAAHLSNYPRTNPMWESAVDPEQDPFAEDVEGFLATMIASTSIGCITFTEVDEDEEEELPFDSVGLTFAEEFRDTYRDWESVDGVGDDFISYFITGYKIHAEGNKKFQSNYLTINYEPDTLGSAYIQGIWDYAQGNRYTNDNNNNFGNDRSDTGRWGSTQQIYNQTDEQYRHAMRKLKVRGHGKALQFKVKSETGKPFFLNGWIVYITGNSTT